MQKNSIKIGWFSTGKGEGSKGLLKYVKEKGLDISYVFCNRKRGEYEKTDGFLDLVKGYNIPAIEVSSKKFKPKLWKKNREKWREKYDKKGIKAIPYKTDIGVLAGYMLITGKKFCNEYDLINLHPSMPGGPKGTWQGVIWEIISSDESEHGAMMHLVTPELDSGPVITYCKFKIKGDETSDKLWTDYYTKRKEKSLNDIIKEEGENEPLFKEIRRRGFVREKPLIYSTLKSFIDGKISIENKTLIAEGKVLEQGYDLTELIDKEVS